MKITMTEVYTMTELYAKVYAVGWGSNHRPFVIERMKEMLGQDNHVHCSVDAVEAVYDGTVMRVKLAKPYTRRWKLVPVLGCFADKASADAYAAKVAGMVEHKTKLHYPGDVVEKYRHVGRRNYYGYRKGLWTKHFPTWKCLLALTALRDAAESMPLQLEFKDDTCMNCTHLDCLYAGRTDVSRCEAFRE